MAGKGSWHLSGGIFWRNQVRHSFGSKELDLYENILQFPATTLWPSTSYFRTSFCSGRHISRATTVAIQPKTKEDLTEDANNQ